jgi:5-methylcytosine-specific restriction enzyme A
VPYQRIVYPGIDYHGKLWRGLRSRQLRKCRYCVMCAEEGNPRVLATVVDHITPHRGDQELFKDPANLQSLCRTHHNSSKQKEEIRGVTALGCDVSGWPKDRGHYWNGGTADVKPYELAGAKSAFARKQRKSDP